MPSDLKDQIQALMETGLRPVTAEEILSRHRASSAPFPLKERLAVTPRRVTTVAIACAAAGCAAAVAAGLLTGPAAARPDRSALPVVTAAYVRQLARASRHALANSGQAVIVAQQTWNGELFQASTDQVTYSGANWNDSSSFTHRVFGKPQTLRDLSRVVDGQAYEIRGRAWYHITGPHAVTALNIPDPRTLLAELAPTAGFVRAGSAVVDGVRVTHLRATRLSGLAVIPFRYFGPRDGRVTALEAWVDSHGVVRRLSMTVTDQLRSSVTYYSTTPGGRPTPIATKHVGPTNTLITSVAVTFLDIGQPQVITAPTTAIPVRAQG